MLKDKLTIYANEEDAQRIRGLVLECVQNMEINMVDMVAIAAAYTEAIELPAQIRCVVLSDESDLKVSSDVRKIKYSLNSTKGDICALNVQKRSTCTCFEVLYGVFMSRVFIPDHSLYTPEQVLMCVCILCGWGASIDKLIPAINELLK